MLIKAFVLFILRLLLLLQATAQLQPVLKCRHAYMHSKKSAEHLHAILCKKQDNTAEEGAENQNNEDQHSDLLCRKTVKYFGSSVYDFYTVESKVRQSKNKIRRVQVEKE